MNSDEELEFRRDFFAFVRRQRDAIQSLRDVKLPPAARKALWCALIDTLARGRYPSESDNRERFTGFIRYCCDWADSDRISLPYLFQFSRVPPHDQDPGLDDVRRMTLQKIRRWHEGIPIPLSDDLQWSEVEPILPVRHKKRVRRDFTAYGLLYAQRNGFVHEYRHRGASWSFDADEPEYTMLHEDGQQVSLDWPDAFFARLVSAGAANLEFWVHDTNAALVSTFKFGVFAYDDLNAIAFDRRG